MPTGGMAAEYAGMQPGALMGGGYRESGPDWGSLAGQFIGTLGDSIATSSGGAPVFQQMQAQRMQSEQEAARLRQQAEMATNKRAYDREDWLFKQQHEAQNQGPAPVERNADYIEGRLGKDAADRYVENYGQSPAEPRMITFPDGRTVLGTMEEIQQMLRGGPVSSGTNIPGGPINLPDGYKVRGGAGSNASGSFR